nr:phage/plasmid primase, P4 family [Candidatus Freyarchaeota archaeon]
MTDCPNIKQFLSEVVRAEDLPELQKFVGYCLMDNCRYQKALMLHGPMASGKSTFVSLFMELIKRSDLTRTNIAAISLKELKENRWCLAELQGKKVNICDDVSHEDFRDIRILKALIAGEPLTAERKYQQPFVFTNRAKLIFATSFQPDTLELDEGLRRRLVFVNFPNQFIGNKADSWIVSKLATRRKLESFMNWANKGLEKLKEQGFKEAESK